MRKVIVGFLYASVAAVVLCGCVCHGRREDSGVLFPRDFPRSSAPSMISDSDELFAYMSLHYWDRYVDSAAVWCAYDDTSRVGGISVDALREAYSEYVRILWSVPIKDALAAQVRMMDRFEITALCDTSFIPVFDAVCSLGDSFLYGVNSELRNEELYIPVLEKMISTTLQTPLTEKVLREKYAEELMNCSKNRIGEPASDFIFATADGHQGTLYGVKGDIILVFFSNPGCSACLEIINSLKASGIISHNILSGRLKVLNIYIDRDLAEWFKYMPVYPKEWVNAYQPDLRVREDGIYDVRAIPSLYILDSEKRVLFKDVDPNIALNFLERSMEGR